MNGQRPALPDDLPVDDATYVGGPGSSRPILLLHGAGLSWRMWLPHIRPLESEYRVIAPDLPAHGRRDDETFSLEAAVAVADEALEDAGAGPALVVGQSLGGYVGIELAVRRPDRVAALALSGASADYRGWLAVKTRLAGLFTRVRAGVGPLERRFQRGVRSGLRSKPVSDAVVDAILEGGISASGYGGGATAIAGIDFPAKLRTYDGPVLLVNGERDRLNRPAAETLAPTLPDARTRVLAEAGHTCPLDRPAAYTATVREFADSVVWPAATGTE